MNVDPERLRERAEQLRNQAEFLDDQAGGARAAGDVEAVRLQFEARECLVVAVALRLFAEVVEVEAA